MGSFWTATRRWGLRRTAFLCSVVGAVASGVESGRAPKDGCCALLVPQGSLVGTGLRRHSSTNLDKRRGSALLARRAHAVGAGGATVDICSAYGERAPGALTIDRGGEARRWAVLRSTVQVRSGVFNEMCSSARAFLQRTLPSVSGKGIGKSSSKSWKWPDNFA